jgi:hypothetical protein
MFTTTLIFLGIAGFIVAVSFCFSTAKPATGDGTATGRQSLTWDEKATWPEIRAAWLEWYARCQKMEAPRQKAMCSWGRTLVLCAGLCLGGVLLEVEFDQPISVRSILAGFRQTHVVAKEKAPLSKETVAKAN